MGNVRIVTNRDIERKLVLFLACLSVSLCVLLSQQNLVTTIALQPLEMQTWNLTDA